jgi:DNA-binding response OmpR family regulator
MYRPCRRGGAVSPGKERVLVVDDDGAFRALARALLERAGFAVVEAADADEALAAVEGSPPQAVLLDVRLPGVSGYEVFRELRDRCGEGLPILFISGERTDPYDRVAGLLMGADDYLLKPCDPDELVARVRRSLRPGRSERPDHGRDASAGDAIDELTPRTWCSRSSRRVTTPPRSRTRLVISPHARHPRTTHPLEARRHNRTQAVALHEGSDLTGPGRHATDAPRRYGCRPRCSRSRRDCSSAAVPRSAQPSRQRSPHASPSQRPLCEPTSSASSA